MIPLGEQFPIFGLTQKKESSAVAVKLFREEEGLLGPYLMARNVKKLKGGQLRWITCPIIYIQSGCIKEVPRDLQTVVRI